MLFRSLTAIQVGNLALYRFDGFHLIHRLNVHTHNERAFHIQKISQQTVIQLRCEIEEQKKAVRAGYDMDIIPSDLATYGSEAKKLLQDLQSRNERICKKETAPYFLPIRNCLPVRNSKELGAIKYFVDRPEGASQSHSN